MTLITSAGSRLYGWTPPAEQVLSLRFPGNVSGSDQSAPYAVIKKANPQSDGFPFWGPGNSGWTVIRQVTPYQQTGYYAQFWWSRDDGSFANQTDIPYAGAHPYPTNQSNTGTSHVWEIATEGGDFFDSAGSSTPGDGVSVTKNVEYFQALRATFTGKTFRFYQNLPSTGYVERSVGSTYGTSLNGGISNWAVIIGDSPWYASFQHERASMDMKAIKIIMDDLSETDILAEAADMTQMVTSAGQAAIWWGKYGFASVDDLTCDFGTGRSFTRVDASNLLSVV